MQNCLLEKGLQILSYKFFDKIYIFCFNSKNTIKNEKSYFSAKLYARYEKTVLMKNLLLEKY